MKKMTIETHQSQVLLGVLCYSIKGARGVGAQTMGAQGQGDYVVMVYGEDGDDARAWDYARGLIDKIKDSRCIVGYASYVENKQGCLENAIKAHALPSEAEN